MTVHEPDLLRTIFRNSFWSTFASVASPVLAFLFGGLTIRYVGIEAAGFSMAIGSILGIASRFGTLGIGDAIVPAMAAAFLAMLVAWGTISPVVPVAFALHAAIVTATWRSSIGNAIPSHRVSSIDCYHVVAERLICTFVWRWLGLAALAALVTTHPQYLPLVPVHLLMFRRGIVWACRHELSDAKGLLRAACQC